MLIYTLLSIVGFAMFVGMYFKLSLTVRYSSSRSIGTEVSRVRYGALFLVLPGVYCTAPPLQAWVANNSAPHIRRATALAILLIHTNSGGILSTWLLGSLSPALKYTKASITLLIFSILIFVITLMNLLYLSWRNSQKEFARTNAKSQEDEAPGIGDDSAWYEYNL